MDTKEPQITPINDAVSSLSCAIDYLGMVDSAVQTAINRLRGEVIKPTSDDGSDNPDPLWASVALFNEVGSFLYFFSEDRENVIENIDDWIERLKKAHGNLIELTP